MEIRRKKATPCRGGDAARRMYRGGRPHRTARVLNRGWAVVGALGLTSSWLVTLETVAPTSGKRISLPVVIAQVNGEQYLVSMLGQGARWVRNVRASGGRVTIIAGRRRAVVLEEVPVGQRAPILRAYLRRAPGARPHIPVRWDAPTADFTVVAADYPVFRIRYVERAAKAARLRTATA